MKLSPVTFSLPTEDLVELRRDALARLERGEEIRSYADILRGLVASYLAPRREARDALQASSAPRHNMPALRGAAIAQDASEAYYTEPTEDKPAAPPIVARRRRHAKKGKRRGKATR